MKSILRLSFIAILVLFSLQIIVYGCGDDDEDDDDTAATGTLEFYTNGEEFIQNGFVGKTGWAITFDHFYVNYNGPTAFQVVVADEESKLTVKSYSPTHAGHPHNDIPDGAANEALMGDYWVDLRQTGQDGTNKVLLDIIENAPTGNYNFLNFVVKQTDNAEYSGYSVVMIGTAEKDEETIEFTIKLTEQMIFEGCEQGVDDENAGVVEDGGIGSMEITFHSDHLFGDFENLDDPDSVNPIALGFQPFANLAQDGVLDIDQSQMESSMNSDDYDVFVEALRTTGHSGEGHCGYELYE